jgi:PAS domain S-box-containing protein
MKKSDKSKKRLIFDIQRQKQYILDNIYDIAWLKDKNSRYVAVNRAFENVCGIKANNIIGKTDFDIWPKKLAEKYRADDKKVMLTRKRSFIEENLVNDTGKLFAVETTKSPFYDNDGMIIGTVGIAHDITKRKKAYVKIEKLQKAQQALKESESRYKSLFESANDAIFLANAQTGFIVDANKKASELIGLPISRIIGMHHMDLHPRQDREFYSRVFNSHASRSRSFSQVAFVCNNKGKHIPVQVSASRIILKGRKFLLGVFSDITELKKMEDRLKKDKSSLEKIVSKERKNLESALSGLEDAKRLADIGALAAMIAHELRNPLGVIKTAVYNIKQKAASPCIEKIRSHVDNIDKKIYESDRIISNLLSYSKALTPFYENLYIYKIIDECIVVFKQKYNLAKVKLIVNHSLVKGVRIKADKVQIISLLSNILDNAYQALPDNAGTIELCCIHHSKKKLVSIAIKDNGIGISKKDQVGVFEPFFSLKSRGIGLGLSVCRQIVKLHNGFIGITSEKSKGTIVKITLPARDPVIYI